MSSIWALGRGLGDGLLALFAWLPPLWALVALSAVLGVALLGAFRLLTPQQRLRRVKDQMSACVYELRLFSADPVLVLRAQGRALLLTGLYLLLALPSFAGLVPVVGAVAARAALRYEYRPLQVGEETLLSFTMAGVQAKRPRVTAGNGLKLLPPLVVIGKEGHVRLRATAPGEHRLTVEVGQARLYKTIHVATGRAPVSPFRARAGDAASMLTTEQPLPHGGPVSLVSVDYPAREHPRPGVPWWVHLLVVSMAAALALRGRLGVVF